MLQSSFHYLSAPVLGISLLASACLNKPLAWSQEAATPNPNRAPTPVLPPGVMDSMRSQINPFQPQKLQMLLYRPEVQAELEIDRNLLAMVSNAMMEMNKKQTEASKSLMNFDEKDQAALNERAEKFRALQVERDRATEDTLDEILPPEKFKRLKQIALQVQIQEAGLDNVLVHGALGESLKFTEKERDELAAKADEYEAEKQAKIRKIMEDYDEKLLKELSPRQRKQIDEQLGERFAYDAVPSPRRMFKQIRDFQKRFTASDAQ